MSQFSPMSPRRDGIAPTLPDPERAWKKINQRIKNVRMKKLAIFPYFLKKLEAEVAVGLGSAE